MLKEDRVDISDDESDRGKPGEKEGQSESSTAEIE